MSNLRVRDLMTPDVHVVHPDDPIARLRELMSEKHIRHVPVVDDDGGVVGLVSERDLLRRAAGLDSEVPLIVSEDVSAAVKVNEVMTWHVETVEADEDAANAAAVMLENKYGCLSGRHVGQTIRTSGHLELAGESYHYITSVSGSSDLRITCGPSVYESTGGLRGLRTTRCRKNWSPPWRRHGDSWS